MRAGEKIRIPKYEYHVTYYKPSPSGNLTHAVYTTPEMAELSMNTLVKDGYQIFNFSVKAVYKETDLVICD